LIIDASVAFKWLVSEPDTDMALAWIGRADLVAPGLLHAEVANALWKRIRRGELAGEGASEQLSSLQQLIRTEDESPVLPLALEIAVELGHPVYDCVYLAMAEDKDDMLLTADGKFIGALRGTRFAPRVQKL
jgi:predicted nucleic acid-binding protein